VRALSFRRALERVGKDQRGKGQEHSLRSQVKSIRYAHRSRAFATLTGQEQSLRSQVKSNRYAHRSRAFATLTGQEQSLHREIVGVAHVTHLTAIGIEAFGQPLASRGEIASQI
jgi:hypothetical protein